MFEINTLTTSHFAPGRLSQGRPRSVIFSLFNKPTFLHQQKNVQEMEDRTEQNFQRSA